MSSLFHAVVFLSYLSVGAAVALALPRATIAVDPQISLIAGAMVFLLGTLLHYGLAQLSQARRLTHELDEVRHASEEMRGSLVAARKEVRELQVTLGPLVQTSAEPQAPITPEQAAAEMRLLRVLLNQLSARMPQAAGAETAPAPDSEAPLRPAPGLRVPDSGPARDMRWTAPGQIGPEETLALTRAALENNRVSLFLQPIVQLPTRRVAFYEAFSRIRGKDDELIGPEHYLGVAKDAGLMSAIDNNLLFRCVQLVRRTRRHNREYGFFCNISSHTVRDRSFFPQFIDFMEINAGLAEYLVFEFAQADIADRNQEVEENLAQLASLGFRFSLDQVGSLDLEWNDLSRRHFRFVKIEAATLWSLIGAPETEHRLVRLQQALKEANIALIVEKVESERTLVDLLDYPIAYGQGYLFGEPRESRVGT